MKCPLSRMLLGAIALASVVSCSAPAPDVSLPSTWDIDDGSTPDSSVELRPDGTGDVRNIYMWDGRGDCSGAERYTGPVKWAAADQLNYRLESPAGSATAGTPGDLFFSYDWDELVAYPCEEPTPDQVARLMR